MTVGCIRVVDQGRLEEALARYDAEVIRAYPGREERIRATVVVMQDSNHSGFAGRPVPGAARESDEP